MDYSFFRFFLASFMFLGLGANAGEIKFTASTNRNPVGTGEQFIITYSINTNASNFEAPPFKDFNVLSGPNQSTSMQIVNGSMSQSVDITYYLQARTEGTFRIEPAAIIVNNTRIKSNPLSITVVKGQGKAQNQQQDGGTDATVSSQNVFLRVSVDKSSVYRGEALVATYKLYTRVNIVNYAIDKLPAFNGFWSQELKMPEQLELHNENLNGQQYRVGVIKKVVLFPQQSGILTLDPMTGQCIARIQQQRKRSNNPFDIFNDPFFSFGSAQDVQVPVKSDPLKINVKELPPITDASFNGSVGRYTIEAKLDKSEIKANDAATLKIKISGKGNIKLIDAPQISIATDIEKYDPKVADNVSVSEAGVSGSKTFEYLLIPRHEGSYTIDPIPFTYFDLEKKQYVKLSTQPFTLNVKGISGDASAASSVSSYQNKSDVKLLGKDIRFIKTSPLTFSTSQNFYGSWAYYTLLALPAVLLLSAAVYKRRIDALKGNVAYMRSAKATKMAQKRLSVAKKHLDENKQDTFYEEIFKALYGYTADKLAINYADLNKENLKSGLLARSVKPETADKLLATINTCEYARFASQLASADVKKVYSDSVHIITELENQLV